MNILRQNVFTKYALMALIVFVFSLCTAVFVYANPMQFVNTTQTAAATSSVVYMTAGNATTTLVADTYNTSATGANTFTNDATELLIQFTASSTLSKLNLNIEYSNGYANGVAVDCVNTPSSCDWYADSVSNVLSFATSSLPMIAIAQVPQYQWGFSSSTVGGVTGVGNRDTRALKITVPTRFVRVVFTCAAGGAGCGVWAQFVPIKQAK